MVNTTDGEFSRDMRYITTRITADGHPVEPGRYRLAVARACPLANRAIIVRRLLGLGGRPLGDGTPPLEETVPAVH